MSIRRRSELKPCRWVGSSQKDMRAFPDAVKKDMGTALMYAQGGGRAENVKTLSGMGTGVLEVVDDHDGDTYRCVYLLRLKGVVYVLQPKKISKSGIKTPPKDKELIKSRIKLAEKDYEEFKKGIGK